MIKNKFSTNLNASHADIKAMRSEIVSSDAEAAQKELIEKLKKDKRELQNKLLNLDDLSPESADSLNVVRGQFDGAKWANELQNTKVSIQLIDVQLKIAEETYSEYFKAIEE